MLLKSIKQDWREKKRRKKLGTNTFGSNETIEVTSFELMTRGGGNYVQVRDVPFFGVPFFEQKINFRVSFLVKSQVVINFWVSF